MKDTSSNQWKAPSDVTSSFPVRYLEKLGDSQEIPLVSSKLVLSTQSSAAGHSEVILDYGCAEGGMPFFETSIVNSNGNSVIIDIIYSETSSGLENESGDGPHLLFSNAMDTYRFNTLSFERSTEPQYVESQFAQKSQRYQKIILRSPESSITFSSVGFRSMKKQRPAKSSFKCSNEKLDKIWKEGVRTVEMCTVEAGETLEAWEVTEVGTKISGQHWAPCRFGTRWGDMIANFEVKIESGGASWGIHMVVNGLIFCLDSEKKSLSAFQGLSDSGGIFPPVTMGSWDLPDTLDLKSWLQVTSTARGSSVEVEINGLSIATVKDLDIHPILGGSANNHGSIAFGGPAHFVALYRSLAVKDLENNLLYENDFLPANKARTMADFAVGTNELACTIDGAKRDRACFAGDLFVMGRSIFYSTGYLEAALGSITLLSSHQTADGYIGNLCPIQAPVHTEAVEPPTYAFYSLSYALALIVATKEYWMHSGDVTIVKNIWNRFEKLIAFTTRFQDSRGLIVAPPPFAMDWMPMGGPIFGASGKINLAFYDALQSMSLMCKSINVEDKFSAPADLLRESIVTHLWNEELGILRMNDIFNPAGICQDINAYGVTLGVAPSHSNATKILAVPTTGLPMAFQDIERWDAIKVVSPYATGFAAEALFARNQGPAAIELIEKVWGVMADESNLNYSGGNWESMTKEGIPSKEDTSLMHGWSTWPVFLLPQYLGGVQPLEPGWVRWKVQPVLAGLDSVNVELSTPAGEISVDIKVQESNSTGEMVVKVPRGTTAEIYPPENWILVTSKNIDDAAHLSVKIVVGQDEEVRLRICKTTQISEEDSEGMSSSQLSGKEPVVETFSGNSVLDSPPAKKGSLSKVFRRIFGACF